MIRIYGKNKGYNMAKQKASIKNFYSPRVVKVTC